MLCTSSFNDETKKKNNMTLIYRLHSDSLASPTQTTQTISPFVSTSLFFSLYYYSFFILLILHALCTALCNKAFCLLFIIAPSSHHLPHFTPLHSTPLCLLLLHLFLPAPSTLLLYVLLLYVHHPHFCCCCCCCCCSTVECALHYEESPSTD